MQCNSMCGMQESSEVIRGGTGVSATYDDDGDMLVECEKDENMTARSTRM